MNNHRLNPDGLLAQVDAQEHTRRSDYPGRPAGGSGYLWALGAVALCTALSAVVVPYLALTNLVMVYLLGVIIIATRHGMGPSIVASILSVLAFDFFFVPPHFTFAVSDAQYLLTFGVMFVVAITISTLTVRIQRQAEAVQQRERRTAALYALSREFARTASQKRLVEVAAQQIGEVMASRIAVLLPDPAGQLVPMAPAFPLDVNEQAAAEWVYGHNQIAGLGTDTLPSSKAVYLPLAGSHGTVGVLCVEPAHPASITAPEQRNLLETFANQTALAIERANLAEETQQAKVQIEIERTRNALLSSVSHDFKTPLAAIIGAASNLIENTSGECRDWGQSIVEEADRLNRLIRNLLDMTRLEAGAVQVHKEWHALEEVIGAALTRLDNRLHEHPVTVHLPDDLPLVPLDSVLIEQVLVNLLENAIKYTPPGSPFDIAVMMADQVTVSVADRGPGIPPGDEERVFEKFYRGHPSGASGVGLGLTVCRGIVQAHGGKIWAEHRDGGGAVFQFTLPLEGKPPEVEPEAE